MSTEAEALTKWCPFARVWAYGVSSNRDACAPVGDGLNGASMCIGSACMAWQWYDTTNFETANIHRMNERPDGDGWEVELSDVGREKYDLKSQWKRPIERRGFCGLAARS